MRKNIQTSSVCLLKISNLWDNSVWKMSQQILRGFCEYDQRCREDSFERYNFRWKHHDWICCHLNQWFWLCVPEILDDSFLFFFQKIRKCRRAIAENSLATAIINEQWVRSKITFFENPFYRGYAWLYMMSNLLSLDINNPSKLVLLQMLELYFSVTIDFAHSIKSLKMPLNIRP